MRPTGRERGQALLLWALTLFLISLMVLVTLGVAKRAHERIEAQVAADAASYSTAVASARAMNMIALLNRAQTSHMVSMLAAESLISWSGVMKAALAGAGQAFSDLQANAQANGCPQADLDEITANGGQFGNASFEAQWKNLDTQAGKQVYRLQGIAGVSDSQAEIRDALLNNLVSKQQMTRAIAQMANPELDAFPAGDARNLAALSVITSDGNLHAAMATMGTRGDPFPRERKVVPTLSGGTNMPHITLSISGGGEGGSGFGKPGYQEESQQEPTMSSWELWAEDHPAQVTISYQNGACSAQAQFSTDRGWARSNALEYQDDQHHYGGTDEDIPPENQRHTLGACTPYCPGIWPGHLDYDSTQVASRAGLFGQPVLYSIVHRDLTQRMDPWNLSFKFFFTSAGSSFDNGNPQGAMLSKPELRYQVALGTSVVYYHRPSNYQEQPNLYNPFWRATLMSMKRYSIPEAVTQLGAAGFPQHGDTLDQLDRAGFKGFP